MAASIFIFRLHDGLTRPAIPTLFPTARIPIVVLDSGANVDCSADELVQFARLGCVYAEDVLGRTNPSVGLLSIGEEPEKGNAVVKEAHALLAAAGLNFHGNVEGRDLPMGASERGPVDVVVCDGFVGNVILKFYESVAPMIVKLIGERGVAREVLAGGARDARLRVDRRRAAARRARRQHHRARQARRRRRSATRCTWRSARSRPG